MQPLAWHAMDRSGGALSAWLESPFSSSDSSQSQVATQGQTQHSWLLQESSVALEQRLLQAFLFWCHTDFRAVALEELFNKVLEVLALLLRCYGNMMFQTGGALSNLRPLLLAALRWRPSVRPFMQLSWEMVSRWKHKNQSSTASLYLKQSSKLCAH